MVLLAKLLFAICIISIVSSENETDITPVKLALLNEECSETFECANPGNLQCDQLSKTCLCAQGLTLINGICLSPSGCNETCADFQFCNTFQHTCDMKKYLNEPCKEDQECITQNSYCDPTKGCSCRKMYKPNENEILCEWYGNFIFCNKNEECASGYYCDLILSVCRPKLVQIGEWCLVDDECLSENSFCCKSSRHSGECKCREGYESFDDDLKCAEVFDYSEEFVEKTEDGKNNNNCEPYTKICPEPCTTEQYCEEYKTCVSELELESCVAGYHCINKVYLGDYCPGFECHATNAHCNTADFCICDDFYEPSVSNKTCVYEPINCADKCPDLYYCDNTKGLCRRKRYLGGSCIDNSQCLLENSECQFYYHEESGIGECECKNDFEGNDGVQCKPLQVDA